MAGGQWGSQGPAGWRYLLSWKVLTLMLPWSMATEQCEGRRCSGPHVPSSPVALCHLLLFIHSFEIQCHSSEPFLSSSCREVTDVFLTVQTLS